MLTLLIEVSEGKQLFPKVVASEELSDDLLMEPLTPFLLFMSSKLLGRGTQPSPEPPFNDKTHQN